MQRVAAMISRDFVIGAWLFCFAWTPVSATTLTVFGANTVTSDLAAAPPSPNLPNLTSYPFDLNTFFPSAFPGQTSPNPLPQGGFSENEVSFNLALLAGFGRTGFVDPIAANQTFEFTVEGNFWRVNTKIQYDAASFPIFDSDVVTLKGFGQHRFAPHPGEFFVNDPIDYEVTMRGSQRVTVPPRFQSDVSNEALREELRRQNIEIPPGARFGFDVNSSPHPEGPDDDILLGLLAGKVSAAIPSVTREDFDFWVGGVSGLHTPEPSTLLLLGSGLGLAGLLGFARTILRNK